MNINPQGFVDKPSVYKTNKFILQYIGPLHLSLLTKLPYVSYKYLFLVLLFSVIYHQRLRISSVSY